MLTSEQIESGIQLRPVSQLCREMLGKRVSPSTVWRWVKRGNQGGAVKLQAVNVLGKWHCTTQQLADFFNANTVAAMDTAPPAEDITDDQLVAQGLL